MKNKKISFIIPLYNAGKYIVDCIDSILRSNIIYDDYEIIIWDDGSKDNGRAEVEKISNKQPNVRLIKSENHGVSYARNHALLEAKGEYIWFVDADDMVVSKEVLHITETASAENIDMLAFCWKAFDGKRESSGIHYVPDSNSPITGKELFLSRRLMMAPWCFIYRRKFLLDYKLSFSENFKTCEDVQFNEKALFWAERVLTSSRIAYIYRVQANTASQGERQLKQLLTDQIRMTWKMLCYFAWQKDISYLKRTFLLNLRGIASFIKRMIQ